MSKLILVTAGTSALEKSEISSPISGTDGSRSVRCQWNDPDDLVKKLNALDSSGKLYAQSALDCYDLLLPKIKEKLKENLTRFINKSDTTFEKLSAELASLLAMERDSSIGKITNEDEIVLLYSDTQDGKLCAEANAEVMREEVIVNGEVKKTAWKVNSLFKIDKLRADDPRNFAVGLNNLKEVVNSICHDSEDRYFNITGGFKGVIPFATALAWDKEMDLVYLFEKSQQIISIKKPSNWPSTPVFEKMVNEIPHLGGVNT